MAAKVKKTEKKSPKVAKAPKAVKAEGAVRKKRTVKKVSLAEVTNVIDQIVHLNQTPEQMVMDIPKKRGPKVKKARQYVTVKGKKQKVGPPHPIKSQFGEPVGILVAKRIDYTADGKVLTSDELKAGAEVAYSKVYVGASRCNIHSGDKFDAATGRAIAMEQIEKMVAGEEVTIAESLVPYLRPFRERCQRYFTKPYAREAIQVVTPQARGRAGFVQKVSYEEKQAQIKQREKASHEAAVAAAAMDAEAQAKREARAKKKAEREAQEKAEQADLAKAKTVIGAYTALRSPVSADGTPAS